MHMQMAEWWKIEASSAHHVAIELLCLQQQLQSQLWSAATASKQLPSIENIQHDEQEIRRLERSMTVGKSKREILRGHLNLCKL